MGDDAVPERWRPDVLGDGFEQLTLPLGADNEGELVATLVRHSRRRGFSWSRGEADGCDVLAVHGWSDYFFNPELAEYWTDAGARFYALDLRKYGRSLRPGQTPGYVTNLADYDADIEAALDEMGHGRTADERARQADAATRAARARPPIGAGRDVRDGRDGRDSGDGASGASGASAGSAGGAGGGARGASGAGGAGGGVGTGHDAAQVEASARASRVERRVAEAAALVGVTPVAPGWRSGANRVWRDLRTSEAQRRKRGPDDATRNRHRPLILLGHSTGGLTFSLWAARNHGRVAALVLNSPWLEFQLSRVGRSALAPVMEWGARLNPTGAMPNVDLGFYTRTVAKDLGGEWEYNHDWRPDRGFATNPAWLTAVLAGHRRVEAGINVGAPVLTMLSARSTILPRWDEAMRSSDIVLVVDEIAERAVKLGSEVTVARLDGAIHDVLLSRPPVRAAAYDVMTRWLRGYLPER